VDDPGQQADWSAEHSRGEKGADEEVSQVGADSLPEYFLRMGGEESLQRNEDDDKDPQPKGETQNRNQHRVELSGHDEKLSI
jgi:hypothetical protein